MYTAVKSMFEYCFIIVTVIIVFAKFNVAGSFETLVPVYQTMWCPTSEDYERDSQSHYSVFCTIHMLRKNVIFPNRSVY